MNSDELTLLHGYLDGTSGDEDFARLQSLLRESAEAREMLRSLSTVDAKLQELAAANPATLRLLAAPTAAPGTLTWISWRPLMAAAAGLVLGLFSASMVWGYVGPFAGKTITLLQDSFESGPAPMVTGVPVATGRWSGDYSEVVGEFGGVLPASGKKMLRFCGRTMRGNQRATVTSRMSFGSSISAEGNLTWREGMPVCPWRRGSVLCRRMGWGGSVAA